jgi:hypothetical protein
MSPSRPGRPKDFSIPLRIEYGEIVVDAFCDRLAIREADLKPQLACYWVGIYPLFVFFNSELEITMFNVTSTIVKGTPYFFS